MSYEVDCSFVEDRVIYSMLRHCNVVFVFFNDTATTEIYTYCHTLSLHDALPISLHRSLMEVGQFGRNADDIYANAPAMYGIDIGTEQGHGFRCIPPENTFGSLMGTDITKLSVEERLKIQIGRAHV